MREFFRLFCDLRRLQTIHKMFAHRKRICHVAQLIPALPLNKSALAFVVQISENTFPQLCRSLFIFYGRGCFSAPPRVFRHVVQRFQQQQICICIFSRIAEKMIPQSLARLISLIEQSVLFVDILPQIIQTSLYGGDQFPDGRITAQFVISKRRNDKPCGKHIRLVIPVFAALRLLRIFGITRAVNKPLGSLMKSELSERIHRMHVPSERIPAAIKRPVHIPRPRQTVALRTVRNIIAAVRDRKIGQVSPPFVNAFAAALYAKFVHRRSPFGVRGKTESPSFRYRRVIP